MEIDRSAANRKLCEFLGWTWVPKYIGPRCISHWRTPEGELESTPDFFAHKWWLLVEAMEAKGRKMSIGGGDGLWTAWVGGDFHSAPSLPAAVATACLRAIEGEVDRVVTCTVCRCPVDECECNADAENEAPND